jgi:uncharacterized protein YyaL (SSP411 family)
MGDTARRYPSGFGYLLSAIDFLLSTPKEVAIVGQDAADIEPLLREVWRQYLPNKVVAPGFGGETDAVNQPPLLQNRPLLNGQATAYVCEHYTCKQPVTDTSALALQLAM